jgi:hypothetical protein
LDNVDGGLQGLHEREANIRAGYVYVISNVGVLWVFTEPEDGGGDEDLGTVVGGAFGIPGGQVAELFEPVPCAAHFRSRSWAVFHGPYRSGRARHGAPVRSSTESR